MATGQGSQHPYDFTGQNPTGAETAFTVGAITSPVTIANTASLTEQHPGFLIPQSGAIAGAMYELVGWGTYSVTGTPTMTYALYLGGTAGTALAAVPAITAGSGVTNCLFEFTARISFTTTTTVESMFALRYGTSSSTDAASAFVAAPTSATTVAVGANGSRLVTGFTWSAASASNTTTLRGGYATRIC